MGALGNRPRRLHGSAKCPSWEWWGEGLAASSGPQMVAEVLEKALLDGARPYGGTCGIAAPATLSFSRPGFSTQHSFRKSTYLSGDFMVLMMSGPQLLLLFFPPEELSTFSESIRKDQTRSPWSWASVLPFPHLATW